MRNKFNLKNELCYIIANMAIAEVEMQQPRYRWFDWIENFVGGMIYFVKKHKKKPRKKPGPDRGHRKRYRKKGRPGRRPVRRPGRR